MGAMAAGAIAQQSAGNKTVGRNCPSRETLNAALGEASRLMQQASYAQAVDTLRPLAALNCDPRASLLLAAAQEAGGHLQESREALEQAHLAWPSNSSVAASLARQYMQTQQPKEALQALAHFRITEKTPEQEMEMAALVYMSGQRLVQAQAAAEAAYKTYPSLHTLLLFANTLQLQGRYPDVNRLLERQRSSYGDDPKFLITLAESEYDAAIYPTALKDIERAVTLDGSSYQAHYILANVLVKTGDTDRAIDEYHAAIKLAPEQPRTYYQLAMTLRSRQDEAGEKQVLAQAIEADTNYAPAHSEMGRILLDENRAQDAIPHLTQAVAANPKSEEGYYLLARAYAKLGEREKSNEVVKRLMAIRKSNRPGKNSAPPPE